MTSNVRGLQQLTAAFQRDARAKAQGAERGLVKAALFLLRESKKIVPVDLGNLKASGEVRKEGQGFDTVARVVYTANYAIYVHEDLDAAHGEAYNEKYEHEIDNELISPTGYPYHERGPNQQAKFLEQPYRENRRKLKNIIMGEVFK